VFFVLSIIAYFTPNKKQKKQYQDFLIIFSDQNIALPNLQFGSNMGWDNFTITFSSEADYQYAKENKLTATFNRKIASYYGKNFDSERAVTYIIRSTM